MKKLSLILLLVVYSLSSTGMTLNFHYCCGKLKKVEFSTVPVECRMKMKHSADKKCCDKNQIDLKVKADQKITEGTEPLVKAITFHLSFSSFAIIPPVVGRFLTPSIFAPPPLTNHKLNTLHCVYRI